MKIQTVNFGPKEVIISVGWLESGDIPLFLNDLQAIYLEAYEIRAEVIECYREHQCERFRPVYAAVMGTAGTIRLDEDATRTRSVEGGDIEAVSMSDVLLSARKRCGQIDRLMINCEGSEYAIIENTPLEYFSFCEFIFVQFHHWLTGVRRTQEDTDRCIQHLARDFKCRPVNRKWEKWHFQKKTRRKNQK